MIPFYILLIVPIVIAPFVKNVKINRLELRRFPLLFFFVMLSVLVALRHTSVGNDTHVYIHYFEDSSDISWEQLTQGGLEIGFQIYLKLVSLISTDSRFFLIVSAIVVTLLIYPTYRRLCEDPSLTIVLFCCMPTFVMMFSGLRQMMAVGIGFIAYEFARRRKLVFFLLAVALAMLFHTSSFILFVMYPVYHMRLTKKWLFVIVPLLLLLFVFNKQVFTVLGAVLGEITRFEAVATSTGAYTTLILFVIFTVFAYVIPDDSLMDDETIGLRNLLLVSLVIQFFVPLHFLAMRMNYYFILFVPLLLPRIVRYRSIKWKQFAVLGRYVMLVFFFLFFFYSAYTSQRFLNVFPYHFFWEYVA